MTEPQNPNQQSPKDQYGGKPQDPSQKPPQKDPCDDPDPKTPDTPKPPVEPDCPPPEKKCPDKKDCPTIPPQPLDPCDKEPTGDGGKDTDGKTPDPQNPEQKNPAQTTSGTPDQSGGASAGGETAGGSATDKPKDPIAAQIAALKKTLETQQKEVLRLEPLKTSIGDIGQRIQALEKLMDGQAAAVTGYKEFYRSIEVSRSEIECFINTVRCQLELKDSQKACICKAIKAVDDRIKSARDASDAAGQEVEQREKSYKRASDKLAWIRKWYDFLKSGVQQQASKQRDDLKTLKGLADPSKNQCETWFYLYELERLITSNYGTGDACWRADINVGTYLECWRPDCYQQVWNTAVVTFNEAEADEKIKKSELEGAKKNAADLDKLARDAESKRREWILKEIKAMDCCGPMSKCPDASGGPETPRQTPKQTRSA